MTLTDEQEDLLNEKFNDLFIEVVGMSTEYRDVNHELTTRFEQLAIDTADLIVDVIKYNKEFNDE